MTTSDKKLRTRAAFLRDNAPAGDAGFQDRELADSFDLLADAWGAVRCERPVTTYEIHGKRVGTDAISVDKLVPVRCDCRSCSLLARIEEVA